jgi:RNA polymerase sigma-70 factor (ECF subfamily)
VVEDVYHEYAPRIYSLAIRMLGCAAKAEDVTQEVLLQVVRRLHTFRGDSTLATWLYRVTINAVLVYRRKAAVIRERHFSKMPGDGGYEPVCRLRPAATPPEAQVLDSEQRERIELAIGRLPEAYRDPFILADIEQLPNAEIGNLLGLSLPAVKSRLHRARLMLRDSLQTYFAERLGR